MGFVSHSFLPLDLAPKKYKRVARKSYQSHGSGHSKSQEVVISAAGGLSNGDIEDDDEHPVYNNSSQDIVQAVKFPPNLQHKHEHKNELVSPITY